MTIGQAPYERDVTRFMTVDAGPPDFYGSRIPFSWCLEEHVRYSKADERFDPSHVPLFPTANWTQKEVGTLGKGPSRS
jgi:hypothetical protein